MIRTSPDAANGPLELKTNATGGGGGGAVTIADGDDVAEGATTDAAVIDPTDPGTVIALLKGIISFLLNGITVNDPISVTQGGAWTADVTGSSVAISGTIAVTQSGAWTVTIQDGGNVITVDGTVNAAQSGTWNINNISGTISLPTGAATEATLAAQKVALSVTALQVTASGDTTLVASGTRKIKRIEASNSHATTALVAGLKVASLNSGAVFGKKYLPAAGGLAVWVFPDGYLQVTSEAVVANLSAAGQVEYTAYYE